MPFPPVPLFEYLFKLLRDSAIELFFVASMNLLTINMKKDSPTLKKLILPFLIHFHNMSNRTMMA